MISFELTEEQKLIQKTSREFAAKELKDISRDCDESGKIPKKILDKAWELGLANAAVPEKCDGIGMERSAMTNVLILEELGYACSSLATAIMAPSAFIHPIIDFGTEDQKRKYLPDYAGEKFTPAAMALHESEFTFDLTNMKTAASRSGDQWTISGEKRLVPFGDTAGHYLVLARTGEQSLSGINAFILPRDIKGLTINAESEKTMGLKPLPTFRLNLDNVTVSESERLGGKTGIDGKAMINSIRSANSAICVGLSRAVVDYSIPYSKERIAFGQPIAQKQAVAFMLAEMFMETESMRWLVWKAASLLDQGCDATRASTLAQYYANKHTILIADNGLQIFGGHGYIRDLPLEMWLRNARTLTVLEGMTAA